MKRITLFHFTLALLIIFCSCTKEESNVSPGELIKRVEATVSENNTLRMQISIEFKKAVTYEIEYWKKEMPENSRMTLSRQADGLTSTMLVLLEPSTEYCFRIHAKSNNAQTVTDSYEFTTEGLPGNIPDYSLTVDNMEEDLDGYILMCKRDRPGFITLCDPKGVIVWYESVPEGVRVATYDPATNTITGITGSSSLKSYAGTGILVIDLFGNRILDKNIESLHAHHDSRRLPDGDIILVNYVPRTYDLTSQGGGSEETVWGDGYTIMDIEGNIKAQWDCFDELDPREDSRIMSTKGDWLHANSVTYDANGNYYMTFNKISQLWKIDPDNGDVFYRVGPNGNVKIPEQYEADGLHAPYPLAEDRILVLDNGKSSGISRALIYEIDAATMTGSVTKEVALPHEYSSQNRSNAYIISDDLIVFGSSSAGAAIFTDHEGTVKRVIKCTYLPYRAEYIPELNY